MRKFQFSFYEGSELVNCSPCLVYSPILSSFFSYVDFLPAYSVSHDDSLGLMAGTCVTNENSMLLSCAGKVGV